jgi:competence protein ComEC
VRDMALWGGIGACAGGVVITEPALAVAFALALFAGLVWARAFGAAALLTIVFILSATRGHHRAGAEVQTRERFLALGGPTRCFVRGRVARAPVVHGSTIRVDVEAERVDCDDEAQRGPARVQIHAPRALADPGRGDHVEAIATLAPPYRFATEAESATAGIARAAVDLSGGADDLRVVTSGTGVAHAIDRARAAARARIEATFPEASARFARALVLGEDDLSDEERDAFRRSGLAHLLAVSGMHLVLVVMTLVRVLRGILVRIELLSERLDVACIANAAALVVTWLYADFAGGSGSAVRAAWMCSVALVARAFGRRSTALRCLGLSLLAMAIVDPLVAYDVSFVLSALATMGLLALARPIQAALNLPRVVGVPLSATVAATIACAPVLATLSPELSVSGVLANVVAVPVGELAALPLCLLHVVLSGMPSAEHGAALAGAGALAVVRAIAATFAWRGIPVPVPTAAQIATLAILAAFAALGARRRRLVIGAMVVVVLEIVARVRGSPRGELRVTFLDVGQGDSALVDLPDGQAILIDGGGLVGTPLDVGARVVVPVLAARRRSELLAVMLSHPHPDHALGLSAVFAQVHARSFWNTGERAPPPFTGGVPVHGPRALCGTHRLGGATVDVLAPCPSIDPDRSTNDNSFVVRIAYGERAFLFVGDAEREQEGELVGPRVRADVLKVGHHGSATSSSERFLDAVRPSVAVISCGARNRFGHPNPDTLARLRASGARVLRTDRAGSVTVTTDGRTLKVATALEDALSSARPRQ